MASRRHQHTGYTGGRVVGNLAYDPAYEERQRRLRREQECRREKVSLGSLCGFAALAGLVALMIMCRAQLTEISSNVVSMQKELTALEDEHVALLTCYEKTFDLTTIKEAAAAAGMSKPSSSQVYYIDLSEPDGVVVYQQQSASVLSKVLSSLGKGVCAVVEYFK